MMGGRRRRRPVAPGAAPRDGDPAPRNGGSGDDGATGIGGALLGGADLSQFDETADGDDVARALGMRANLLGDEAEAKARKQAMANLGLLMASGQAGALNSISPEWECLPQHSGINKAIAKACVEEGGGVTAVNDALQQAKHRFVETNGAGPTYGDVLVTPTFGALKADGFTAIAHALGADCSDRGKRYAASRSSSPPFVTRSLQPAACSLPPAACRLQPAACSLPPAACSL